MHGICIFGGSHEFGLDHAITVSYPKVTCLFRSSTHQRGRILQTHGSSKRCSLTNDINLVGGLVAIFYFPRNIGCLIIPIDVHIFQRGGEKPPTRWYKPLTSIDRISWGPARGTSGGFSIGHHEVPRDKSESLAIYSTSEPFPFDLVKDISKHMWHRDGCEDDDIILS